MKKVAMIGVGKLGQDCAEVMADAGYDVVGYDVETRLPMFPMKDTIEEAVKDRDLIFIAAPTPHDPIYGGETPTSHLPNKDFDYTIVTDILKEVNKHVNRSQLVVLISTVLPGTVRSILEPCITNARFIYNPYLIAMGTVKWDMVNPEMVIIGTEDGSLTGDASELIDFYKVFMQNDPRYEVGTWDEAESIKIFYNTFISTKLALVNMIQDVAETNGNINVDIVTNALAKSNYRITGPAYMKAAFGDAGACHPRDNIALRYLSDRLDMGYDLFDAIMKAREVQAERMALRCLRNGKNITIVGKAYKPAVPYTIGSASMLVGYYIEKHGGNLNYYDPNTGDMDLREDWTHVYLIGYWEDWVEKLQFSDPGCVVIDPWRKLTTRQHTGEIIHYGDTRSKKTYSVPESTIQTMRNQVYEMFTDLRQHDSEIHLVDSTINMDTTFVLRPTEDLVKELLEAKAQGRSKFLFFAPTEAFMPHVVSKVQRLASILDGKIDEADITVITGVIDADEVYERLLKKNGWNKRLNLLNCHFFNYITTTYARGYEFIGGYDVRFRGKIFTCFNKLNREHRLVLLERMLRTNLIDNAYYSFEGESDFKQNIPTLSNEEFPEIKRNEDRFPIRLNITPERHNPVDIQPDDLHYYKDSYFSIVSETLFYNKDRLGQAHRPFVEDSLFLTEKTYRCFATLHPFILMARPHSLKELRKQGYKTFTPFINESYDDIEDDNQRFEAIFKEIVRLNLFTGADWTLWQEGIKPIVEYNKEFFHNNKDFAITKDYLRYFGHAVPAQIVVQEQPKTETPKLEQESMIESVIQRLINGSPPEPEPKDLTPMEALSNKLDWRNSQVVYDNGITLNFPCHIDGGGDLYRNELIALIERTGQKTNYESALDWCAGHGPFGFELIDSNIAEIVTFMDSYAPAIESCIKNAQENNIADKVTGYTCDKISLIPITEKFDLVVANPPHSNITTYIEKNEFFANTVRMIVDEGFEMHREFFDNIHKYLTDDADVYITAGNNLTPFANWAYAGQLKFMGFSPCASAQGGIYHFRKITPN
jgi:UDPglucose 6-dehydrogenase